MTDTVVVAFGANMGHAQQTLIAAYQALAVIWRPIAASSLYRSTPVGGVDQDDFVNAVAVFDTADSGLEILEQLHRVENEHHRTREIRWGPRTLDLDIIALWHETEPVVSIDPVLTLPHPRAWERVFVIAPWLELDLPQEFTLLPGHGEIKKLPAAADPITQLRVKLADS